jgi:anaerobic magnesium-protoporphyrin IX monomethyl ester cyclase
MMRVLLVDLNNFSRYPTISIGYLAAILRAGGVEVEVFSPLQVGVTGVPREGRARPWGSIDQRLRYWSAHSRSRVVRATRERLAALAGPKMLTHQRELVEQTIAAIERKRRDVVLISTYLMYRDACAEIATACEERKIPVLIGGPYFSQAQVRHEWVNLRGIAGIVGGEVEPQLPQIVRDVAAGAQLENYDGIFSANGVFGGRGRMAAPLKELDALPFADYSDFPWERYPNRIIPIITGRGCGWGACTFCSDVTSTVGRTFRSRSPENVLAEIEHQARKHSARQFVFTDLKLNSNLAMWQALLENFQRIVPGGEWIAAVHVGANEPNGLTRDELRQARAAGMVRLTTGLESGSQRVLDSMAKGTDLAVTSKFLHDAAEAGISVRVTMITGYPGEVATDVEQTAEFLERHHDCIERVMLNRFAIMTGTHFERTLEREPARFPGVREVRAQHREAHVAHAYAPAGEREYRRAMRRVLAAAHRVNRKELLASARPFEGVM